MRRFFLPVLLFALTACQSKPAPAPTAVEEGPGPIQRVWIFNDTQSYEIDVENEQRYGGQTEYKYDPGNFINLQPDGSFTSFFNAYVQGRWSFDGRQLVLIDARGRKLEFQVRKLTDRTLIARNLLSGRIYRFKGYPNRFDSEDENPFAPVNNRWRTRPARPETDAQLTARLKNHFGFWERFFRWADARGLQGIEYRYVPSVLDMRDNGFKVHYWVDQLPEWKNCFYDSTNCWSAYERVHYLVVGGKVQWPKEEPNRFAAFARVFRTMQEHIGDPLPEAARARQASSGN